MKAFTPLRTACAFGLSAGLCAPGAPASEPRTTTMPANAVVTFAGTGVAGNADGPLATATFSSPASIAVAPNGDVYVADRALNTIRVVHAGAVSTIVGDPGGDATWREGGYRDGPASQAQLDHPEAIAVAADGSLVIADSWNACIRRYRDGVVSTIAGSPKRFGATDGDGASVAAFKNPIAVAVDAQGAIYVADRENPVRRIDPRGMVSSLALKTTGIVFGLATAPPDKLFVADEGGLLETNTVPGTPGVRVTNTSNVRVTPTVESGAPLGHPFALSAAAGNAVAYSDLTDDSIHVAVVTRVERIAGEVAADPNEAGGFRDGPPLRARFNGPAGLARYANGWLVADAGNHRIRFVPGFDTRNAASPNDLGEIETYLGRKRPPLVVIGNSEVWFDTNYRDSIAGRLAPLVPAFDVLPVAMVGVDDPSLAGNWLANALDIEAPAQVVYVFNDAGITEHSRRLYTDLIARTEWRAALEKQFATLRRQCAKARLVVVDIPIGLEASPSEGALAQRYFSSTSSEWQHLATVHALAASAARASGVRYVDLWPAFRRRDASGAGPLYHAYDPHLSAIGRAYLAELIARVVAR